MNAAVKPGEPFVCWACQRECFGAVIQTGDVVICEPCNECTPSPLRIAYYDPARLLADRERAQEPALPPMADAAQPEQPHPPADSSTATEPSHPATETHGDGGGAGASLLDQHRKCACRACVPAAVQGSPELSTHERPPVSDAVRAERCPPPPDALVGALQERIHPTSGRLLGSKRLALPVPLDALRLVEPGDLPPLPEPCRCPRANMSGTVAHTPQCAEYVRPASASQAPATAEWYGEAVAVAYDALRAIDSYRLGAIDENALGLELLRASNALGAASSRARYRAAGGKR